MVIKPGESSRPEYGEMTSSSSRFMLERKVVERWRCGARYGQARGLRDKAAAFRDA